MQISLISTCPSEIFFSPRLIAGIENQLRRTKPNCERLAEHQLTLSLERVQAHTAIRSPPSVRLQGSDAAV